MDEDKPRRSAVTQDGERSGESGAGARLVRTGSEASSRAQRRRGRSVVESVASS